jgi:DNA-binding Lrp family transcriptional regulator
MLGFPVTAYLWLTVAPAHLDAACRVLATHPEAPFVAAVSGQANVVVSVTCRTLDELYEYTTARLGVVEGVQAVEVAPVLRKLKQAGALVDGDRLAVG